MQSRHTRFRALTRLAIALTIIAIGVMLGLTGLQMWLAPSGRGSESAVLLLGLNKTQLRDLHFWSSMIAMGLTLFHIALDWKVLVGYFRCLGGGRGAGKCE